jgi:hypothetical protein
MAVAVLGQREWTCPDCWDVVPITMTMRTRYDRTGAHHAVVVDDADVRAHLLMHELCTCRWEVVESRTMAVVVRRDRVRIPAEDCPIHEEKP